MDNESPDQPDCFMFSGRTPWQRSLSIWLILGLFLLVVYGLSRSVRPAGEMVFPENTKQKGAHVFGRLDTTNFDFLTRNNIEWVTLVPWTGQNDYRSLEANHHYGDSARIQQMNSRFLARVAKVRSAGFKVFVKPHVWVEETVDGKWRSDIFPETKEHWEQWKRSYVDFIIRYAVLAEQAEAEMFCVGTELSRLSMERPAFWRDLIDSVRSVYSGQITYAANWYQEYTAIPFWDELDYIGIQAYFPLTKANSPNREELLIGWESYLEEMRSLSTRFQKPILFTELGYKSTSDAAIKPWEWVENPTEEDRSLSMETQVNCYEAFFTAVWPQDWFAGVHIWQLRGDYLHDLDYSKWDFTPLGKPAEATIAKGFQ